VTPLKLISKKAVSINRLCTICERLVSYFPFFFLCPWSYFGVVDLVRPKAGRSEVREAVLLGEHRLMSLPLYVPLLPA
jgi:hypothetical protein